MIPKSLYHVGSKDLGRGREQAARVRVGKRDGRAGRVSAAGGAGRRRGGRRTARRRPGKMQPHRRRRVEPERHGYRAAANANAVAVRVYSAVHDDGALTGLRQRDLAVDHRAGVEREPPAHLLLPDRVASLKPSRLLGGLKSLAQCPTRTGQCAMSSGAMEITRWGTRMAALAEATHG